MTHPTRSNSTRSASLLFLLLLLLPAYLGQEEGQACSEGQAHFDRSDQAQGEARDADRAKGESNIVDRPIHALSLTRIARTVSRSLYIVTAHVEV